MSAKSITEKVLSFWFGGRLTLPSIPPASIMAQWFQSSVAFDQSVRDTFLADYEKVLSDEHNLCTELSKEPYSALAAVIMLDQFSRNMFRGTPRMFAADPVALELAKQAINQGFHHQIEHFLMAQFLFLVNDHETALGLYEEALGREVELRGNESSLIEHIKRAMWYEEQHFEIIRKFGRYPHRNAILGRESTPEEKDFDISF